MTEAELAEANGLIARLHRTKEPKPSRWDKIAYTNRLTELGVKLNPGRAAPQD